MTKTSMPSWLRNELAGVHSQRRTDQELTPQQMRLEAEKELERAALLFALSLDVQRRFPLLAQSAELLPLPGGAYVQVRSTVASQVVQELGEAAIAASQRYRELVDAADEATNGKRPKKRARCKGPTKALAVANARGHGFGR